MHSVALQGVHYIVHYTEQREYQARRVRDATLPKLLHWPLRDCKPLHDKCTLPP